MFEWHKKEKPFLGIAGLGGGVSSKLVSGSKIVDVEIHIYAAKSSSGGRGGDSPYGGYTYIVGTSTPGTTIAYVCGRATGSTSFYYGGSGPGPNGNGGGFSGAWVSNSNVQPISRNTNYILGVAGGSGAGGDDGYGDARGGYGGGTIGGTSPENPNLGLAGTGGTQSAGGTGAGSGGEWYGGNGNPSGQCGGGGGGWYGGGGGNTNGGYDAGGGGGSGYIGSTPRTLNNPQGTFKVTGGQTLNGDYPGPGAPSIVTSTYPHTGDSHPANIGRVYIVVDGVEVLDARSSPTSGGGTYTIP